MQYRNLEQLRIIIKEATGLDISYAYDDLVFPDHTAFIIQYHHSDNKKFNYYYHKDCDADAERKLFNKLEQTCTIHGCTLSSKSAFQMKQIGEKVNIEFLT